MHPSSIAIFGGDAAAEVIHQCRAIGYTGDMWPVNPRRDEVAGLPCFDSVADLPGVPDASFLGTSAETTVDIVRELSAIGAGGAVCYAAGFAETGASGVALQKELVTAAGDMALIGPNCHGIINYLDRVALWPDKHGGTTVDAGVAFVLQSGNIGISISMQDRSLPISHLITIGNKADLGVHDYVDCLLDDPRVSVICLHIENLDDIPAFSRVALRALQQKIPIVALKTGTSELGALATLSHTSSLAGPDELYDALFRRFGIARTASLHEFLETAKFLAVNGALAGNTIASISCSGGEASMIADQAQRLDLEMPAFSDAASDKLHAVLGDRVHIANPLDYHTYIWGDYDAMRDCFVAVLQEGFDCTIFVIDYPRDGIPNDAWALAVRALVEARNLTGKCAVVMSTLAENIPAEARAAMLEDSIAPMQGLKECLVAIKDATDIGRAQSNAASITALEDMHGFDGTAHTYDEFASKAMLAKFDIAIPPGQLCAADDVLAAANSVGYPVCLKVISEDISHKSDVGGVRLDLRDDSALLGALGSMASLGDKFLVESMAPVPVAELIIGVKQDRQFGLVVVVGAGGILVEMLRDTATLLLPATRADIAEAVSGLKIFQIIDGFRGAVAGDREATIDAIEAVVRFAGAHRDTLLELDINPLFVLPQGQGVIAVDALLRMAEK